MTEDKKKKKEGNASELTHLLGESTDKQNETAHLLS